MTFKISKAVACDVFTTAFNLTDEFVKPSFDAIETANHGTDTNDIENVAEIFKEGSDLHPTFKPVIVAMINDAIAVITDARRVDKGTLNPVFATCVQDNGIVSIIHLKNKPSEPSNNIVIPSMKFFMQAQDINEAFAVLDDEDSYTTTSEPNPIIMDGSILVEMLGFEDTSFTDSFETKAMQSLYDYANKNEVVEHWFGSLYKIIALSYVNSASDKDGFQKPNNGYSAKVFTNIPRNYKENFLTLASPFTIQKEATPVQVPDKDDDEEDDMFTSSLVNDSIMTTPITRKRKPETSPEEVTDPEPPKASIEAAKVNINLDGKDLLKMLEIRGTSSSAYKKLADKCPPECKKWIAMVSENQTLTPSMNDALECTTYVGGAESIYWTMKRNNPYSHQIEIPQESLFEAMLKNKIAKGDNVTQVSDIEACVSIAGMKPKYRQFTSTKSSFGVFIPETDNDFLDQLKSYSTFLHAAMGSSSLAATRSDYIINRFNKVRSFLHNQFEKYGKKCGNYFITLIHNLYNTYFTDIKAHEQNTLEVDFFFHRLTAGEDLNLGAAEKVHEDHSGNGLSWKKRSNNNRNNNTRNNNNGGYSNNNNNNNRNNNNNGRYNNNNNNNNNNGGYINHNNNGGNNNGGNEGNQNNRKGWILDGRFGDFFNPEKCRAMNPAFPSYNNKLLCGSKAFRGFCRNTRCSFHHELVAKNDQPMRAFITGNNLPITFRE
jgi:hypothetical protein